MTKLIKKIFNNLLKPHRIPIKLFIKLNYYLKCKNYNQDLFENEQNSIFNSLGMNREHGIKNLDLIKKNLGKTLEVKSDMSSEHEVIFSSLSINKSFSIIDILEIGTFDGFNSLLLSNLFPNSKIDTIDLPEEDENFINFYNRKNKVEEFTIKRNSILSKKKNVNFFPLNSLKLLKHKKKYDLIWIDGAHGYPIVCIDIINSLHLINEGGIIICDDIYLNLSKNNSDNMYHSIASYETLNELKKQNVINFTLVYKRINKKNNCIESKRKFVAIVRKI